ncbi:kelch domain-containing protein 4 [Cimex lectularius]|uniref:Kelch domain-containing protein 4 n=1 Tax=Cimex lectularius TaxID=79782 RepID=A0A8I6RB27_CIMLE|nr:kelch domain-containing protein 4 [Cimex lectularius]
MGKTKKKTKGKGTEKTLAKTEKKLIHKFNKQLSNKGEEDIEAILAKIEKEEQEKLKVVEVQIKTPPTRRCFASLTAHPYKDELILFGGELCTGDATTLYNDLFLYKIATKEWVLVKSPCGPPPISSHQAVAVPMNKGELWVFGGEFMTKSQSQCHHFKDLWMFSLDSKRWSKIVAPGGPSPRSGHRMVLCKRQLILFGGYFDNLREYKYFNDVYAFNLDDRKWAKLEPTGTPPTPRSGCLMAVTAENKIVVWGGYSRTNIKKEIEKGTAHSDMFLLSPERNDTTGLKWKWSIVKPGGVRYFDRSGVSCAYFNNKAYTFGGSTDHETEAEIESEFHNDLHVLSLDKFMWNEVTVMQKKKQKKPRRKEKQDGEEGEEESDEEETPDQEPEPKEIVSDGVFTMQIGPPKDETPTSSCENVHTTNPNNNPHSRINAVMTIKGSRLYIYGGLYEDLKKNIDYTLNDLHSIDIKKFDEWEVLIPPDFESQDWHESTSESSSSSEEEDEDSEMEVDSDDEN